MRRIDARMVFVAVALAISACGGAATTTSTPPPTLMAAVTVEPTLEQSTPLVVPDTPLPATDMPQPAATAEPPTPQATTSVTAVAVAQATAHPNWIEVWDKKYGYGVALPCWWTVTPTPLEGMHGAMTVRNYDDVFVEKNTVRGEWPGGEPPSGVVKIDFAGWEGLNAKESTASAVRRELTNDEQTVQSVEERTAGAHPVIVADVRSNREPDTPFLVYVYRLAPDLMLLASVLPNSAVDSSDVQAILASLALTISEKINVPSVAPSAPLTDVLSGCRAVGE
ncbi:MAG: hypothetical protein M1546_10350 [Chloroflexi bacterium]|nr:hypothetical protein [Chloroflexota bacterium]